MIGLAKRAAIATIDLGDPSASETGASQLGQIRPPLSWPMTTNEARRRAGILGHEGRTNLVAHLKSVRSDCWPEPSKHVLSPGAHGLHRPLQNAGQEPAPAGVGRRHHLAPAVTQQDR